METSISARRTQRRTSLAFTVAEVVVAILFFGIAGASFFLGFGQGFGFIGTSREDLRATQILQDKMEILRLYTWDQITNNGFIPLTFTEVLDPSSSNQGVTYY